MNQHNVDRSTMTAEQRPDGLLKQASRMGERAADEAKTAASEAASSIASQFRSTLDGQVEVGATYIGHAASSVRSASAELSKNAPALADFVGAVADKLEGYSDELKGKSAEEVWTDASNFTRRQPALVFGMAAVAGFLAYRTIKSASSTRPRRAPTRSAEEFHGA